MRDPRSHRRYVEAARTYKQQHHGAPCALCGRPVVGAATIEHRLAVRIICAMASTYAEAVDLACDQSMWGIAHPRCNSRQGAQVVNAARAAVSRW